MTIYDKGLLRAMKAAFRDNGYDLAMTENGLLIQTGDWGVLIRKDMVPSSIKSLIVLHSGDMPKMNSAIHVHKAECNDMILETAMGTMDDLANEYTAKGGFTIKPTIYVRTEMSLPEDRALLQHLSQMQWIPVEAE